MILRKYWSPLLALIIVIILVILIVLNTEKDGINETTGLIDENEKSENLSDINIKNNMNDVKTQSIGEDTKTFTGSKVSVTFSYPSFLTLYEDYSVDGENIRTQVILYEKRLHPDIKEDDEAIFIDSPSIIVRIYQKTKRYTNLENWIRKNPYSTYFTNFSPTERIERVQLSGKTMYFHNISYETNEAGVYVYDNDKYVFEIIEKMLIGNSVIHKRYQLVVEQVIKTLE